MASSVFLSSTIRDLADLRSAVRFYLEQFGFNVFTSETPDFPHDLDTEARHAALSPIEDADYYILILGFRTGSKTADGISVTRSEFRLARELHRVRGRPRVVLLARDEVLAAARYPSPPTHPDVDDWPHVLEFIEELGTADDPNDSNWLHPFGSFDDIAATLRATMRITGPLRRLALEANLREELGMNAERLLMRYHDFTRPVADILRPEIVPPPTEHDVALDRHGTARIWIFRFALPSLGSLAAVALGEAVSSGEFLAFDPISGVMAASPAHSAMLLLRQRIARYETLLEMISSEPYLGELATMRGDRTTEHLEVSTEFRALLYSIRDEVANISAITRSLLRYLHNVEREVAIPELNPPSPLPEEAERIEAERVTRDQALAWMLRD